MRLAAQAARLPSQPLSLCRGTHIETQGFYDALQACLQDLVMIEPLHLECTLTGCDLDLTIFVT
jgi:hypothetical protein